MPLFKKKTEPVESSADAELDEDAIGTQVAHGKAAHQINSSSLDSSDMRKGLNEDGESDEPEQVRAVIRVRPLTDLDQMRGNHYKIIQASEDNKAVQVCMPDGRYTSLSFDGVYDEGVGQPSFFETSGVRGLILQALNGYAATIFAFGQTGSGKTFTITGPEGPQTADTVGIVPRALSFIFHRIAAMRQSSDVGSIRIQASYLEIYNEHVLDLLNPQNTALPVRWSAERGFYVENLFIVDCEVLDDSLAVLEEGLRNRTVAAHDMNEHSSRSHSVLTIYFETHAMHRGEGRPVKRHGKVSFVDLAGSEKVKASKTSGDTFTEALNINKSLLTLGQCISALSDPRKRQGHIPFRDSKLTKLLADSMGGHGLALMIACVSPGPLDVQETLKTLRYASKARKIQNKPMVMLDPREEMVLILKREIQGLRKENMALRGILEGDPRFSSAVAALGTTPAMVGAMDDVLAKAGKSRVPTASRKGVGGYATSSALVQGSKGLAFPPLPHGVDPSIVTGGARAQNMTGAGGGLRHGPQDGSGSIHGSAFGSPMPTLPAFPPVPATIASSTGRHSAQESRKFTSRSPSRSPSRSTSRSPTRNGIQPAFDNSIGPGHDRRRLSSAHDAGPPTLATRRVNALKRSTAPAGHAIDADQDPTSDPANSTENIVGRGSASRSPSRAAVSRPNERAAKPVPRRSPTRQRVTNSNSSTVASPSRRGSIQSSLPTKKTNRIAEAKKTRSIQEGDKVLPPLSKATTLPKRPTNREHPPSAVKNVDEFASPGSDAPQSSTNKSIQQSVKNTNASALGVKNLRSGPQPKQNQHQQPINENVAQIVKNRHQIMQDVHVLNTEIGKMSVKKKS